MSTENMSTDSQDCKCSKCGESLQVSSIYKLSICPHCKLVNSVSNFL